MGAARAHRPQRRARREAFERRVFRLALLLTGSAEDASRTLDRVAASARDLARIDAVHLDRLTVLHARDVVAKPASKRGPADDEDEPEGPATDTMRVLMHMKPQAREAWVLTRVDELDDIHVARAMDASKTASAQHLAAAERLLADRLGDDADAGARALAEWARAYDPDAWLIVHRDRVKRRRLLKRLAVALAVILALAGAAAIVAVV